MVGVFSLVVLGLLCLVVSLCCGLGVGDCGVLDCVVELFVVIVLNECLCLSYECFGLICWLLMC